MSINYTKLTFLVLFLTIGGQMSFAQQSRETFGKNRLQYKNFNWRYFSTENFDIYFYEGGQENAKLAAAYLEEEFERITDILGYAPYSKTKIFLYNSVTDLQQSNVGINENNFTIGGQTNFVKLQAEIAYPGEGRAFKNELVYQVSKVLINDMMFGGSLSDMLQNAYLLSLPDWFINGAARYIADGWSVEMDDYMRDLLQYKEVKKMSKFKGEEAELAGQSVWNFISERYGRANISNILNLTRIIRNEETSVANTLGMPFKSFLRDWQQYYLELNEQIAESYIAPADSNKLRRKNRKGFKYNNVRLSPDGTLLAYSENENGKYKVKVRNLENGRETNIFTGGYKVINQEVNGNIPLLSWQDNTNLGIIGVERGSFFLWVHNLADKRTQRVELNRFNQVRSFDFSPNGGLLVLSADVNGQNDVFLYSITRHTIQRLTNDLYDDLHPRFIPDANAVVFSSNRTSDSLNTRMNELEKLTDNFNLFIYDLDTTETVLSRVTNTISKDIKPIAADANNLFYISDQKGINNIFKYNLEDSLYNQVSNFNTSLKDFDINVSTGDLAFIMLEEGRDYVYHLNSFNFDQNIFTRQTRRQDHLQARFVSQRINQREQERLRERSTQQGDISLSDTSDVQDSTVAPATEAPTGIIDTDNYTFDREVIEQTETRRSYLSGLRRSRNESRILGPLPYETRFSTDNVITSWVIDPLRGFGIQLEIEMNDMLENHKFFGGVMAIADLKSGDIFAEYQYLKHYVDFSARYNRKSIYRESTEITGGQRYILDRFEIGASLPLSVTSRLTLSPFAAISNSTDIHTDLFAGTTRPATDNRINYGGGKAEFVFDNTIVKGLNLYEGTRAKIKYEYYHDIAGNEKTFSNLTVDIRKYQKIHRDLVFATRLFYGGFFGKHRQDYLLGGMDNWLFNKTDNEEEPGSPLNFDYRRDNSNILFTEFVTNMRGFNYNKFNGTNALLFNAELRFPIIKYFSSGPIASNFFRNFQLIGFYDIGSAWSGDTPWSQDNSRNTEIIKRPGSAFQARIKNFNNPWISSYGTGLRTVLLGYYMKFDVAWPIEDYEVKSPKFYITLGYDF